MQCEVLKFGGTSVGDVERINHVADIVAKRAADFAPAAPQIAVIVSAMSGETDRLIGYTKDITGGEIIGESFDDEYDAIVSSGELVTAGLLALALRKRGLRARSWAGWQIGLETNNAHAKARISGLRDNKLQTAIQSGEIAVIAGFQGITDQERVTTLGRGGSDTSAVAIAAGLGAKQCDIYTDVDGVYTTDPRIEAKARKIDRISYEEMLELASLGAKVLQTRSVELAMNYSVPLRVISTFDALDENKIDTNGTWVISEDDIVEQQVVTGVAYSRDEAKITLLGLEDHPGIAAELFACLADANVNVDMIVQAQARGPEKANMSFTVAERDCDSALKVINDIKDKLGVSEIATDRDVAKVSVVGVGMRSHAGVARAMFEALAEDGINIQVISTSEIKISVLIEERKTELAVRALHAAYDLATV